MSQKISLGESDCQLYTTKENSCQYPIVDFTGLDTT